MLASNNFTDAKFHHAHLIQIRLFVFLEPIQKVGASDFLIFQEGINNGFSFMCTEQQLKKSNLRSSFTNHFSSLGGYCSF